MANRLKGKCVLLTGSCQHRIGNPGLFVAEGATVAVVDIDEKRGMEIQSRHPRSVKFSGRTFRARAKSAKS